MSRPAGFEHSLDTIRKIRHAVTKKFSIIWFLKREDTVELTDNLSLWASRNKLSKGTLWNTSKHKTRKYKGWKVQRWDITTFSQEIIEKLLKKIPKNQIISLKKFTDSVQHKQSKKLIQITSKQEKPPENNKNVMKSEKEHF